MNLDQLLSSAEVIVCVGSGGVGKTTLSSGLAVRGAQLGRRVLVITVDPAKRLAQALGFQADQVAEHLVFQDTKSGGELWAATIDSKKIFDQFVRSHAGDGDIAQRVMNNRLYEQLSTSLAGSQEFTSLERLLQAHEAVASAGEKRYNLVILDTPPTKHAVDFLTAPERLSALFEDSVTKWFSVGESGTGLFASLLNRGTRTVLKSMEILTGAQFIEELTSFFAAVRSMQGTIRSRSERASQLLKSTGCHFVLVTSFDEAKLIEGLQLKRTLGETGHRLSAVILNRAFPLGLADLGAVPSDKERAGTQLARLWRQFRIYHQSRYTLYNQFESDLGQAVPLIRVPEYDTDVYGLEDLGRLAQRLAPEGAAAAADQGVSHADTQARS